MQGPASPLPRNASTPSAFTLIEVVLALGIVTVAMVTMIGLLPVGLGTLRDAMDATVKGGIVQRVTSDMLTTPYSQIVNSMGSGTPVKTYYFDQEGFYVGEKVPGGLDTFSSLPAAKQAATRFQVVLTCQAPKFPATASTMTSMTDSELTMVMTVTFYGRQTNASAGKYSFQLANQGGYNAFKNPTAFQN
jgi:hypothetical protein